MKIRPLSATTTLCSFSSFPEHPGFIHKAGHHGPVCQKKVLDGERVQVGVKIVGLDGVSDLLDFLERGNDSIAFQNGLHLTFR